MTSTIKQPKLQETSTRTLFNCIFNLKEAKNVCKNQEAKEEIIPILIRRISLPAYIPVIALMCSFLLLKSQKKFLNRVTIFLLSFIILILTELVIRYTGLNSFLRLTYILLPFILLTTIYIFLLYKFKTE